MTPRKLPAIGHGQWMVLVAAFLGWMFDGLEMGIFPLVYLYAELFNRVLPSATPVILKVLAVTALVVPTMSYVVAPRLTRLFKDWLYPRSNL